MEFHLYFAWPQKRTQCLCIFAVLLFITKMSELIFISYTECGGGWDGDAVCSPVVWHPRPALHMRSLYVLLPLVWISAYCLVMPGGCALRWNSILSRVFPVLCTMCQGCLNPLLAKWRWMDWDKWLSRWCCFGLMVKETALHSGTVVSTVALCLWDQCLSLCRESACGVGTLSLGFNGFSPYSPKT